MSVTKITESYEQTLTENATERTIPRVFTITFDTNDPPLMRPILARIATTPTLSIPPSGSQYPFNQSMILTEKTIKATAPLTYEVTCKYSTVSKITGGEKTENPLLMKPQVLWTFATSSEKIDRAIAGLNPTYQPDVPIMNSAGQSFDPPIMEDKHDLVLHYGRNERYYNPLDAVYYKGAVNNGPFFGIGAGLVMCTVYDGELIYDDKWGNYYRVTREFVFRLEDVNGIRWGWVRRILDEGFYEKTGTNTDGTPKLEDIKDKDGNLVSQPVLLNGYGRKLSAAGKPVWLLFKTRRGVSFSPLNIII